MATTSFNTPCSVTDKLNGQRKLLFRIIGRLCMTNRTINPPAQPLPSPRICLLPIKNSFKLSLPILLSPLTYPTQPYLYPPKSLSLVSFVSTASCHHSFCLILSLAILATNVDRSMNELSPLFFVPWYSDHLLHYSIVLSIQCMMSWVYLVFCNHQLCLASFPFLGRCLLSS